MILEHDHPFLHWDFLLETETLLTTWRLLQPPAADTEVAAERLPDHRRRYLTYEGPVSGDRGSVTRIAAGTFEDLADLDVVRHLRLFEWPPATDAVLTEVDGVPRWTFRKLSGPVADD